VGQSGDGQTKAASRRRAAALAQPGRIATPDLAAWLLARKVNRIAGFLPLASEVDVRPTLTTLARAGVHIALPRMRDNTLDFVISDLPDFSDTARLTHIRKSELGTLEPHSGNTISSNDCDAILLPALACDYSGSRLGRGGGYYDRALAQLPDEVILIAVVLDSQLWVAGDVPVQNHDVQVHAVATPTALVFTEHGEGVINRER